MTFVNKIQDLLTKTYFTKVVYNGEIWMAAFNNRPRQFMGHDVEFYDHENDCWDNAREYIESETKTIMVRIINILVDNHVEDNFTISLEEK